MKDFARSLASTLLDGPLDPLPMAARVREAFGGDRPWMQAIARAAAGAMYPEDELELDEDVEEDAALPVEPTVEALAAWLVEQRAFHTAIAERPLERSGPPPEMCESPWHVPALATSKELANWFGITVDDLIALADRRDFTRHARDPRMRHYRYRWIAKRGGHRLLEAPKRRLRTVQRYILDDIIAQIPPHAAAHGFRRGHSIIGFAAPHVGRAVVVRVDLETFFASVTAPRVHAIFAAAGYPREVAITLAALCTHRTPDDVLAAHPERARPAARLRVRHLPQGAPTSGALANLAAYHLDLRVAALAATLGAHYTRYTDDLVLSGDHALARAAPSLVARLGAIAIEEGFALNFRKTRVMTRGTRQRITGVVVNDKLAVARDEIDRLRAILHNCARTGPTAQNRDGHADFRAHLLGRIAWIASIDAVKGARLHALFARIRWDSC